MGEPDFIGQGGGESGQHQHAAGGQGAFPFRRHALGQRTGGTADNGLLAAQEDITRGKKLVVLIGQRKALAMAVKNNRTENRFSSLLALLLAPI